MPALPGAPQHPKEYHHLANTEDFPVGTLGLLLHLHYLIQFACQLSFYPFSPFNTLGKLRLEKSFLPVPRKAVKCQDPGTEIKLRPQPSL